jgi:quercetin dioxygenase-like cupin family protein
MTAVVHSGPLERLQLGAGECLIRLRGEDTGGQLSIVEFTLPAGAMGAMPHIHSGHSEEFVVLAGEVTFDLLEEDRPLAQIVGAGGTVSVPPGVAHGFRNESQSPALIIGLFRPGGYEGYFREVHEMVVAGHEPTAQERGALRAKYRTVTL